MNKQIKNLWGLIVVCGIALSACSDTEKANNLPGLKDALGDSFLIGAALNINQFSGGDTLATEVVKKHFNAIVAENCMKSMYLQPEAGRFFFDDADRFVAFGEQNSLTVTGHCLIWHSQAPAWFFSDAEGNDVSRDTLIQRMKDHITTVVSRYKGRIKGWDVVNEAILDDGSWRPSKFYTIVGEDFIRLAFQFAHEADPGAELYYNDFSMAKEGKRQGVVRLVKSLQEQGVRIDAVGMQGHLNMEFPSIEAFDESLLAFAGTGVKVMITELDLSVLPSPRYDVGADIATSFAYQQEMNPYPDGLPENVSAAWEERMAGFFDLFLKRQAQISRVTLWGVSDANSWLNDWPIPERTNYPLLFDRNYQAKPIVQTIINRER
jgi:endo-1,4-beta-xylanase